MERGSLIASNIDNSHGGTLDFTGGRISIGSELITGLNDEAINHTYEDWVSANFGVLAGAGGLTKVGNGTLTIGSWTNYSGPTKIENGTLVLSGLHENTSEIVLKDGEPGGVGTLIVEGGEITTPGNVIVETPLAAIHLNGGNFTANQLDLVEAQGAEVFHWNSGTLRLTGEDGLKIDAGDNAVDKPFGEALTLGAERTLVVDHTTTIGPAGALTLDGGALSTHVENHGTLALKHSATASSIANHATIHLEGRNTFTGAVSGSGAFVGGGTAVFAGSLSLGNSAGEITFDGDVELAGTNTLFIEVGGTLPGSEHDALTITSSAVLDGVLHVSLLGDFLPELGQQFTILTASEILDHGLILSGLAGSMFDVQVNETSVVLEAISESIPADFNGDGMVDHADLAVWEASFGIDLLGDANGDGIADGADFLAWQQQFGNGVVPTPAQVVPEPNGWVLAMLAWLALYCKRRSQDGK